jgi:hypothetical protein
MQFEYFFDVLTNRSRQNLNETSCGLLVFRHLSFQPRDASLIASWIAYQNSFKMISASSIVSKYDSISPMSRE